MSIKRTVCTYGLLIAVGLAISFFADGAESKHPPSNTQSNPPSAITADQRISLALPPALKQRQLIKMRSLFKSIQDIVYLIGAEKFIEASNTASAMTGGGKGKKKLSDLIANDAFKQMSNAFHQSTDDLSKALQTKDTKKSLTALHATMAHCTQCHAVFRQ